jgi:hypothetical protein
MVWEQQQMSARCSFRILLSLPLALACCAPAALCQGDDSGTVTRQTTIIEGTTTGAPVPSSDTSGGGSSSSEYYSRGVGFKNANVFNPKYRERLATYAEQVEMGLSKGWLTPEEGAQFKSQLARLNQLEETVRAAGYPKDQLDNLEKEVTRFNMDLTTATNKPVKSPVATPAPAVVPVVAPTPIAKPKVVSTPAKKPPAKPSAKKAVKKKK